MSCVAGLPDTVGLLDSQRMSAGSPPEDSVPTHDSSPLVPVTGEVRTTNWAGPRDLRWEANLDTLVIHQEWPTFSGWWIGLVRDGWDLKGEWKITGEAAGPHGTVQARRITCPALSNPAG